MKIYRKNSRRRKFILNILLKENFSVKETLSLLRICFLLNLSPPCLDYTKFLINNFLTLNCIHPSSPGHIYALKQQSAK